MLVLALVILTEEHNIEDLAVLKQLSVADSKLRSAAVELAHGGCGRACLLGACIRILGDIHEVHGIEDSVVIHKSAAAQEEKNGEYQTEDPANPAFFVVQLIYLSIGADIYNTVFVSHITPPN